MVADFKRIGGEIISSPLNENFRKLRNDISIANVNLAFSTEEGIKNTIEEMLNIKNPINAQTCYVISSGEFYRYSKGDNQWHKIMDIGQTFRQGFLNSGAVVLEDDITLKEGSNNILVMPRMLTYFKNKDGDVRYLKGMYCFEPTEVKTEDLSAGAYSIKVDCYGDYSLHAGMPEEDNPNYIYIGSVIIGPDGTINPDFIFTIPDIAYTADRGAFMFGSQSKGLSLTAHVNGGYQVNRQSGYYYDEGVNFIKSSVSAFPDNVENGANYNLKSFGLESGPQLYYMAPFGGLSIGLESSAGLRPNLYYKDGAIVSLKENFFTIQTHLITPNGKNIIVYGSKTYNSIEDAYTHINDPIGISITFPCVEATRIVLGNVSNFQTNDEKDSCRFETLSRLSQVGTISPEFADNVFKIYSGVPSDSTPAMAKFDLSLLYNEGFNDEYNLVVGASDTTKHIFGLNKIYDYGTTNVSKTTTEPRTRSYLGSGYLLADNADIEDVRERLTNIESEIWKIHDATQSAIYRQGIRYRLYDAETKITNNRADIDEHAAILPTKADKSLKINDHTLDKDFNLTTTDIGEGSNLYYTTTRVQNVPEVKAAKEHYEDVASDVKRTNPHNLYADDLKDNGINYHVVSTAQVNKINNLYDNTKSVIENLDAKTMDYITVDTYDNDSSSSNKTITNIGDIKRLRFYEHGVNLVKNGDILEIDCTGHTEESNLMWKKNYATVSDTAVDRALSATSAAKLDGIEDAAVNSYYGTNADGDTGFHKLKVVTTTLMEESDVTIDNVIFEPTTSSVGYDHLQKDLRDKIQNNYHTVYDGGELKSANINEFSFGDNIEVIIENNKATLNVIDYKVDTAVREFANLHDVEVVYTNNAGKMLVVNNAENGIAIADARPMSAYMLIDTYGEGGKGIVQHSKIADRATNADNATNATKLNGVAVDNSVLSASTLWTSSKIKTEIDRAVDTCFNTYYGTSTPGNIAGSKEGDIYIMVE